MNSDRVRRYLDIVATIAMIAAAGTVLGMTLLKRTSQGQKPPVPKEPQQVASFRAKGRADAPVVMIENADFECSACGNFVRDVLPAFERDYIDKGLVRLVFNHNPLPMHKSAARAAEAAECAATQGRFWSYHDLLFRNQQKLDDASLVSFGEDSGLDPVAFKECLSGQVTEVIARGRSRAAEMKLNATPTFFIGTSRADGRVTVLEVVVGGSEPGLKKALDAVLAQAK